MKEMLLKVMTDVELASTIKSVELLNDKNAAELVIKEVLRNRWYSDNETIVELRNKIVKKFGEIE
jgi:hypothetical protein